MTLFLAAGAFLEEMLSKVAKNFRPILSDPRGHSVDFLLLAFLKIPTQKERYRNKQYFYTVSAWGCVSITPEKAETERCKNRPP